MIEKIRDEMNEVLAARPGAGRADLVLLLHPDTARSLAKELGQDAAPERAAGIAILYTDSVDEDEFRIEWRDDE